MSRTLCALVIGLLLGGRAAQAATVDATITDSHGSPASNAVVSLTAMGTPTTSSRLPAEAIIDQHKETFVPLVTIIRTGGHVTFANNDTTMHQVYSFSPIRQFALEIGEGRRSQPVVFDAPGIAAIGCNIHDHMIAFVYVTDSPWVALSDTQGHVHLDAPPGTYRVDAWHPQLAPGHSLSTTVLTVNGPSRVALSLPLLPPPPKHLHMGTY